MTEFNINDDGDMIVSEGSFFAVLDSKQMFELIQLWTDGYCAICLDAIPEGEGICCECLKSVYAYHQIQHACGGI